MGSMNDADLLAEIARLRSDKERLEKALREIAAFDGCACTCDDENCCLKMGEQCSGCEARASLSAPAEKEKP